MRRVGLRTALMLTHLVVLVIPVIAFMLSGFVHREMSRQAAFEVKRQAPIATRLLQHELDAGADLATAARTTTAILTSIDGEPYPLHAWVYAPDGALLADNAEGAPPPTLEGLPIAWADRVDIRLIAPDAEWPWDRLLDRLLGRGRVASTVPVRHGGQVVAAVVLARTSTLVSRLLFVVYGPSVPALIVLTTALAGLLALWVSSRLARSLSELAAITRRVADGDLEAVDELEHAHDSHLAEVRALSTDLQRMATRLRERVAFVEAFASTVAHELRTPLSTLTGTIELLQDHADLPAADRAGLMARAAEQLTRMRALITGLLALARAEKGTVRERVDLQPLLAEAGLPVEGAASPVRADPTALRQVVDNLVENALRHGQAPVRVVAWTREDHTGFDVIDAGPGVPPEHLPHLFDRFYTTDRAQGLGLGLALVRAIVIAHGGSITLDSQPGAVRFRVELPRDR